MAKKAASDEYDGKLALYESLVATVPGIERKGASMPYTSLNGNMFSLLTREGTLALRLPEQERDEFLKKYKTKLVEQYGIVMKEYVAVPDDLLARTDELAKYFQISVDHVSGLKPKTTTRKKPTVPATSSSTATKRSAKPRGSR